jgi:hypothetical protein
MNLMLRIKEHEKHKKKKDIYIESDAKTKIKNRAL